MNVVLDCDVVLVLCFALTGLLVFDVPRVRVLHVVIVVVAVPVVMFDVEVNLLVLLLMFV